jgi:very-short-patch-repair endonuclease
MTARRSGSSPLPLRERVASGDRREPGEGAPANTEKARALRRSMTDAERKLWRAIRDRQIAGAKFRRQVPIGKFVADFLCYELRIVIEVDGGQHANSVKDGIRDRWFRDNELRVLRFWNNEVLSNLQGVLEVIAREIGSLPPHPAPRASSAPPSPARGEGEEEVAR